MKQFPSFAWAISAAKDLLEKSSVVNTGHWQGVDIKNKPEMSTYEITHFSFKVPLTGGTLEGWRDDIKPNLPWADKHFEERVSGVPLNPGHEWKNWPYAHSAANFLTRGGNRFDHTYAERLWPQAAGHEPLEYPTDFPLTADVPNRMGIYDRYGDLDDVVQLLIREPTTRQAYVPLFFPEDTGAHHGRRIPCTLGYHFLQRNGRCDITYYIRSVDFTRHFRDDIYLTLRLLLWMIEQCAPFADEWSNVQPGVFVMHVGSLHLFVNDYTALFGR